MATGPDQINEQVLKKINDFAQILQNFGLNLIQSIGQMKHSLEVLTEKVDKVDAELIELKGLKTQLGEFSKFRKEVSEELSKIGAYVKDFNFKLGTGNSEHPSATPTSPTFQTAREVLDYFDQHLKTITNSGDLVNLLKTIREQLFIITGGHKILFEIREIERKIRPNTDLEKEDIKGDLLKKSELWKSMF